eukprot:942106_1
MYQVIRHQMHFITSNCTILIGLNCDDTECDVDSEALEQRILVAIEGDVEIFRSEIRNDEIIVTLSITTASYDVLQTDQIKRDIENEIEDDDQLGNVDVEGEMDSGDHNDSVDTQKQNEFKLFNWIPWPWSMESAYASVVTIPMCCCVTFICWICLKKRGKRNMSKELETYQISDKTCKMEVPEVKADNEDEKENGDTDVMPQTRDATAGSQDKGQGESGDDQHSDTEELYVEHVTMK